MNVLVLGAGGMAGHVVALYLKEAGYTVDTLSAHNRLDKDTYLLDVTDSQMLTKFFKSHTYDIIINCIGALVKQSEDRKDLASYLNAFLPHHLEHVFAKSSTKIVHLSTDCVFSGKNPPYQEDTPYDGELFYDRSKALGELKNDKDLTFRMSIVGPDMQTSGIGLFNWFWQQKGEISGYSKAIWSGVTTIELARGIQAAIEQNLVGLYHLVPKRNISKFELLNLFKTIFGRDDISIIPNEDVALDKTLINTRQDFDFIVNDYEVMIETMKAWINGHPSVYPHYARS